MQLLHSPPRRGRPAVVSTHGRRSSYRLRPRRRVGYLTCDVEPAIRLRQACSLFVNILSTEAEIDGSCSLILVRWSRTFAGKYENETIIQAALSYRLFGGIDRGFCGDDFSDREAGFA